MAPELFTVGTKKSRRSDIYSFGMTIVEVRETFDYASLSEADK